MLETMFIGVHSSKRLILLSKLRQAVKILRASSKREMPQRVRHTPRGNLSNNDVSACCSSSAIA